MVTLYEGDRWLGQVAAREELCAGNRHRGMHVRKVYVSTVLDQSVDDVWAVLGDFHRIDIWMQSIHESTPEDAGDQAPTIGSVRRLTVGDDRHTTRERLVAYDARCRQMTYEFPDTPRPFG